MNNNTLNLGYDLDAWLGCGVKIPITTDISPSTNSQILLCGMSDSGKSSHEQILVSRLSSSDTYGEFYFADYKGDDSFAYLRTYPRYYSCDVYAVDLPDEQYTQPAVQ